MSFRTIRIRPPGQEKENEGMQDRDGKNVLICRNKQDVVNLDLKINNCSPTRQSNIQSCPTLRGKAKNANGVSGSGIPPSVTARVLSGGGQMDTNYYADSASWPEGGAQNKANNMSPRRRRRRNENVSLFFPSNGVSGINNGSQLNATKYNPMSAAAAFVSNDERRAAPATAGHLDNVDAIKREREGKKGRMKKQEDSDYSPSPQNVKLETNSSYYRLAPHTSNISSSGERSAREGEGEQEQRSERGEGEEGEESIAMDEDRGRQTSTPILQEGEREGNWSFSSFNEPWDVDGERETLQNDLSNLTDKTNLRDTIASLQNISKSQQMEGGGRSSSPLTDDMIDFIDNLNSILPHEYAEVLKLKTDDERWKYLNFLASRMKTRDATDTLSGGGRGNRSADENEREEKESGGESGPEEKDNDKASNVSSSKSESITSSNENAETENREGEINFTHKRPPLSPPKVTTERKSYYEIPFDLNANRVNLDLDRPPKIPPPLKAASSSSSPPVKQSSTIPTYTSPASPPPPPPTPPLPPPSFSLLPSTATNKSESGSGGGSKVPSQSSHEAKEGQVQHKSDSRSKGGGKWRRFKNRGKWRPLNKWHEYMQSFKRGGNYNTKKMKRLLTPTSEAIKELREMQKKFPPILLLRLMLKRVGKWKPCVGKWKPCVERNLLHRLKKEQ